MALAKILFVGPLPPPVHGFSVMNQAVSCTLREAGLDVVSIDTAPGALLRTMSRQSISAIRKAAKWLSTAQIGQTSPLLYLGVSGGGRQIIDLLFVLVARVMRFPVVLHHHSFAYIRRPTALSRLLFLAASRNARHIVLCGCMQSGLRRSVHESSVIMVLSNLAFLQMEPYSNQRTHARDILFFSNISAEKGIEEFIDVIERARRLGSELRAHVAGPFADERSRKIVAKAVLDGIIEYHGPVYAEVKTRLFQQCDILLFPTRYVNEAEPVVVLEALASGLVVIASDRGCIAEQILGSGLLISETKMGLEEAASALFHWSSSAEAYARAKHASREAWERFSLNAKDARTMYLTSLGAGVYMERE